MEKICSYKMNTSLFLVLFISLLFYCLPQIVANSDSNEKFCPFHKTVNLTNHQKFENGSYLYEGILVPPEKQTSYNYQLRFLSVRETVPQHIRGCICEKRVCMKLCCPRDKFFNEKTSECEKITSDIKVSWQLQILLKAGTTKTIDIFDKFTMQYGLPCDEPEALEYELDKWILKEDGITFVESDKSNLNTLNYCYSPRLDNNTNEYLLTPFSCPIKYEGNWKLYLNTYAMTVSVFFLIPTILVYLILKELRGNLRGKLLICYLLSLTIGYAIISFINISDIKFNYIPCTILGLTCYFFFMAAFLWLSVLCFDIWKNFKETNVELNSRKNYRQFIVYSLYAWLSSGLATTAILLIQLMPHIDDIYKPGIGVDVCWLNTNRWSAAIYFYGPNLIILVFNFITFAHLTTRIYNVRRDLARMTHKEKFFQENAVVILRLFLIMGISWLFDILSYCMRDYEEWEFVFVLSDFANAIQGLLIFSLFVLKPNVLNLLKKRFNRFRTGKQRKSVTSSNTNFSKLQSISSVQAPITP